MLRPFRLVPLTVLVCVTLFAWAGSAHALSCAVSSLPDSVARAHLVFTGTVTQVRDPYAVVDVAHYYKGSGPAAVTVERDMWSSEWQVGDEWLLFINVNEGRWQVGPCAPNHKLSLAQGLTGEEAAVLGTGQPPEAPPPEQPTSATARYLWLGAGTLALGLASLIIYSRVRSTGSVRHD